MHELSHKICDDKMIEFTFIGLFELFGGSVRFGSRMTITQRLLLHIAQSSSLAVTIGYLIFNDGKQFFFLFHVE